MQYTVFKESANVHMICSAIVHVYVQYYDVHMYVRTFSP